nr:MAG TPA: hypothetical protein [Caudoviricetes sp.]
MERLNWFGYDAKSCKLLVISFNPVVIYLRFDYTINLLKIM